jgi:hypothetical protein
MTQTQVLIEQWMIPDIANIVMSYGFYYEHKKNTPKIKYPKKTKCKQ